MNTTKSFWCFNFWTFHKGNACDANPISNSCLWHPLFLHRLTIDKNCQFTRGRWFRVQGKSFSPVIRNNRQELTWEDGIFESIFFFFARRFCDGTYSGVAEGSRREDKLHPSVPCPVQTHTNWLHTPNCGLLQKQLSVLRNTHHISLAVLKRVRMCSKYKAVEIQHGLECYPTHRCVPIW